MPRRHACPSISCQIQGRQGQHRWAGRDKAQRAAPTGRTNKQGLHLATHPQVQLPGQQAAAAARCLQPPSPVPARHPAQTPHLQPPAADKL